MSEKKPKPNSISPKKFLELRPEAAASFLAKKLKLSLEKKDPAALDSYNSLCAYLDYSRELPKNLEDAYYFLLEKAGYNFGPLNLRAAPRDLAAPRHPPIGWKVALNSFRSGYNVGSVFRIADAFCFEEVILGGYSPGPDKKSVISAAMGAEQYVPYLKESDFTSYLEAEAKSRPIVALEIASDACLLENWDVPAQGVLVLGNEERGIEESCLNLCSHKVEIPLFGRKHSLNVSTSFAIAAAHIFASLHH